MRWQDVVIAIAQVGFIIALLPTIKSRYKPALWTSIMYAVLICVVTVCFITLRLWFSALTAGLGAIEWVILAVQKHAIDKQAKAP